MIILSIKEFMDLCLDPTIVYTSVYNINTSETVWSGFYSNMPTEYVHKLVDSFDVGTNPDGMEYVCFNVDI